MNLEDITADCVSAVNPPVTAQLKVSLGSSKGADYGSTPTYAAAVPVDAQVQALQFRDIQQIEGLNLQGTRRAIYLRGDVEGLVRANNRGGDLITMPDGTVWLVAMVLEAWLQNTADPDEPGWVKVAVTLQNNK